MTKRWGSHLLLCWLILLTGQQPVAASYYYCCLLEVDDVNYTNASVFRCYWDSIHGCDPENAPWRCSFEWECEETTYKLAGSCIESDSLCATLDALGCGSCDLDTVVTGVKLKTPSPSDCCPSNTCYFICRACTETQAEAACDLGSRSGQQICCNAESGACPQCS